MGSEWIEDRFGKLVQFVSEKSQAKDAKINTYISTENMLVDFGGVTSASALPLNGSVTCFKVGDTLFSNIRTYFKKVWQAKFDGCCSNDVLVFRSANTEMLLQDYLHQICRWEKFTELSIRTSKGAKMPRGDKDALADFKFEIPSVEEQRAIAHILGTLDDKIELNRRMNATLEAMAQALFKSWFVDFDPVRANAASPAEEDGLNALPPEIAALFPDAFEESELGLIPKGWKEGTLSDLAVLNPESWSKKNTPTEIEYIDLANTKWGTIESTTRFAWADAPSRAQRILRAGDTIVGTVRPGNGSYSYVGVDGLTASTGFAALRPKDDESRELLYLAATSSENIERLSHLADGGVYPAVRPDVVLFSPVIIPNKKVLSAFSKFVAPLIATIERNKHEATTLAALRDTLLPKLISGELRVGARRAVPLQNPDKQRAVPLPPIPQTDD